MIQVGIEPTTLCLKGRYSTAELLDLILVISFSNKFVVGVPVKKNLDKSAKCQFFNCLPSTRESRGLDLAVSNKEECGVYSQSEMQDWLYQGKLILISFTSGYFSRCSRISSATLSRYWSKLIILRSISTSPSVNPMYFTIFKLMMSSPTFG